MPGGWSQGEGAARAGVAAQWMDEKGHVYGVATSVPHLCIPALPVLAAGSHLNFNLSPLAFQQDTPLPRLQSHLPPNPPPPHSSLPVDVSQLPHVGLALLLPQEKIWQGEKRLQQQLYLGILPQFLFH